MSVVNTNNPNAPYIREILDKTNNIGGHRISTTTLENTRHQVFEILKQQQTRNKANVRKSART